MNRSAISVMATIPLQCCREVKDESWGKKAGAARFFVLAVSLLQCACMATVGHYDASRGLCYAGDRTNGWADSRERTIDGVDYLFKAGEIFSPSAEFPIENVHWIWVQGFTFGIGAGMPSPPMVFDPIGAELEIDGKIIKALPRLWWYEKLSTKKDVLKEVSIPANINVLGEILIPEFLIAFPVEIKSLKAEYTFRPGTILLDGVRYPLPEYTSCYTPGRTWINPIK